jgi:hypothetical protein
MQQGQEVKIGFIVLSVIFGISVFGLHNYGRGSFSGNETRKHYEKYPQTEALTASTENNEYIKYRD